MKKSDDKKPTSEKPRPKSDKSSTESKSEIEPSEKYKNASIKSINDKNGMLCPKSVRNQLKKVKESSEKDDSKFDGKDGYKIKPNEISNSIVISKKPILNISDGKVVEVKINKDKSNLSTEPIKSIKSEPSLSSSDHAILSSSNHKTDESDQSIKRKKKKKHGKSKNLIDSDDGNKDVKNKKSRKSKKKKHKDISPVNLAIKDELHDLNVTKEVPKADVKIHKPPMSLLVSYSSDEEESHNEPQIKVADIKISPEIKTEATIKELVENKIEIKIKPTKSPGKSAWDSSDSELDNVTKEAIVPPAKSRSPSAVSKHSKKSKSSSKEKSESKSKSKSLSKSHSGSRSKSGSHSRSRTNSRSSKSRSGSSDSRSRSYSRSHSKSYSETSDSRSRSYSRSRSRSKRKSKRHRRHSSSYSRSRSRYRSRSVSRTSSDSGSSRSYSRSRSRFKSSYSTRYRSRSRSRSSRSRSRNSYYRSSYRRHKRSSSPDNFLNPQNRKTKQILNRNSLLGGVPKPVDISKKIDAIKESQKKAAEAHSLSNLNIPLPPEKPKITPIKPGPGEWCPSMDFGGPVAKKAKKAAGNKMTVENKSGESNEINSMVSENHLTDYNYIGPQVSSDMAKKLGLDVKASKKEKENSKKCGGGVEHSLGGCGESYLSTALDANHLALQSRAYQHRLNNLQGHSNSDFGGQTAQYFQSLYMSPSSLTNNLTATALAAVASEQLPASVAGSLAQAAVQRIMSSSNLTATYNTPSVVATPTASYQTALQHTLPGSCSTLVASTPSGLVPISLLQQGGVPYGINQLVLQHLQQQALNAQLGQAIAIPNQSILGGINPLLFQQASNQQALLQSLGFGAQTQLLASPPRLIKAIRYFAICES